MPPRRRPVAPEAEPPLRRRTGAALEHPDRASRHAADGRRPAPPRRDRPPGHGTTPVAEARGEPVAHLGADRIAAGPDPGPDRGPETPGVRRRGRRRRIEDPGGQAPPSGMDGGDQPALPRRQSRTGRQSAPKTAIAPPGRSQISPSPSGHRRASGTGHPPPRRATRRTTVPGPGVPTRTRRGSIPSRAQTSSRFARTAAGRRHGPGQVQGGVRSDSHAARARGKTRPRRGRRPGADQSGSSRSCRHPARPRRRPQTPADRRHH